MLKPESCRPCDLYQIGRSFSVPDGNGISRVMLAGESLGDNEAIDGKPFRKYAVAGFKLEQALKLVADDLQQPIDRDNFVLYNIIACQPPNNRLEHMPYEWNAIRHCSQNFDNVVNQYKPNVIVALGNVPLRVLTGVSGNPKEKQSNTHLRGYPLKSLRYLRKGSSIPVISSLHPSFIARGNSKLLPQLVEDIKKALRIASGEFTNYPWHPNYKKPKYNVTASLEDLISFYNMVRDNENLLLTYDIETQNSAETEEDERDELERTEIEQIQFSIKMGMGIALPFVEPYLTYIRKILSLPNGKANHNTWNFDNPILRDKGYAVEGRIDDTQWMFKHWHPNLPRGLQAVASLLDFPFPWKHLYGKKLRYYGCADVDAVQWIMAKLPQLMKDRGVWRGYIRHVRRLYTPTLERAKDLGIPVDDVERLKLKKSFKKLRRVKTTALELLMPEEIRAVGPRRKDKKTGEVSFGYIKKPTGFDKIVKRYHRIVDELRQRGTTDVLKLELYLQAKFGYVEREVIKINSESGEDETIRRWFKLLPLKTSSQQLIRYLQWKQNRLLEESVREEERCSNKDTTRNREYRKRAKELRDLAKQYEVPIHPKTKKLTTSADELDEIFYKTGDEVLSLVMEIRSLDTNINNYIPNWKPGRDGRVHTEWGFGPPTGQLAARRPNVLNCSKHTEYGKLFRSIIVAPAGYCFVEFDKKSFHVATLGYRANSKNYIRFSQLNPHSIFTSFIMPPEWGKPIEFWAMEDDDIMERCRWISKRSKQEKEKYGDRGIDLRQQVAKPSVLGNQLGMGAQRLWAQNRRSIEDKSHAERLQATLADIFPEVEDTKEQIRETAHEQTYLINEFGRIQYFFEVFKWTYNKKWGKWDRRPGADSEKVLGFAVQSPAFGMLTEEMLLMEKLGINEEHNFINTIHDSLIFMPEVGKKNRCLEEVSKIMHMPCKYLVNQATGPAGLVVAAEASLGTSWANMEEIKL